MIRSISALIRGRAHEGVQAHVDAHALTVLRQQIRDAAVTVKAARHAVAVATAQARQEGDAIARVEARIADLEARTLAALDHDEALAADGAAAIATLEEERDTGLAAKVGFEREIEHLRMQVRTAEARLRKLKRGRDLAQVTERTQAVAGFATVRNRSTLDDAEETLERLRHRQVEREYTQEALAAMDDGSPDAVAARLRAAGCGSDASRADDVMARLKAKRGAGPVTAVS